MDPFLLRRSRPVSRNGSTRAGELIGSATTAEDYAAAQAAFESGQRWEMGGRVMGTAAFVAAAAPLAAPIYGAGSGAVGWAGGGATLKFLGGAAAAGITDKIILDTALWGSGMAPDAFARYYNNPGSTALEFGVSTATAGVFNGGDDLLRIMSGFRRGSLGNQLYRGILHSGAAGRVLPRGLAAARSATPAKLFVHLTESQYDAVRSSGYLGRGYRGVSKILLPPFDEGRIWATAYSRDQLRGFRGFFRAVSEGMNPLTLGSRTHTIQLAGEAAAAFARPRGVAFSHNLVGWLKGTVGTQRQFRGMLRYLGDDVVTSLDGAVHHTPAQMRLYRLGEWERMSLYGGAGVGGGISVGWWLSDR